jgi:hypothetical protein
MCDKTLEMRDETSRDVRIANVCKNFGKAPLGLTLLAQKVSTVCNLFNSVKRKNASFA